jgi:transposase
VDATFKAFVEQMKVMGLKLLEMDKEEKMFVIMRFEKVAEVDDATGLSEEQLLKACLYKKR